MMVYDFAAINEIQNELSVWLGQADDDMVRKINNQNKKQASLCARALLYKTLFLETGIRGWSIKKDDKGKPFLSHDHAKIIPHISLSHSSMMVAVAISFSGPIGVDIEDWQERDIGAIASYAYGPHEINEVVLEGPPAFYRIWTVREAIAKMEGNGALALMNGEDHACGIAAGQQSINGCNVIYKIVNDRHSLALAHNLLVMT